MAKAKAQYASSLVYNKQGTTSHPLYIADKYPAYQVDFSQACTGKQISISKRRIRFRFGFASPSAIDSGLTGVECRGEEHEIVLVWSISSGKRLLICDGQEVHYSFCKESKFEFTWNIRGNHTAKIIAYSSGQLFGSKKDWRQFDFLLDGCSFFDFCKIHELGVTAKGGAIDLDEAVTSPRHGEYHEPSYRNYAIDAPPQNYVQDLQQYQEDNFAYAAPRRSYHPRTIEFNNEESKASDISRTDEKSDTASIKSDIKSAPTLAVSLPPVVAEEKQDLLDFAFETTSNPVEYTSSNYNNDLLGMSHPEPNVYYPPQQQVPQQPPVQYNSYVNNVMHAYNTNPAPPPPQDIPTYQPYPQQQQFTPAPPPQQPAPTAVPAITYTLADIDESPEPVDEITKGVSNLVNLDDLTQPAEKPTKLTMNSSDVKKSKHSKGLPPKNLYTYNGVSLSQMQSIRGNKEMPAKEIMRNNMNYGNAHHTSMTQYARYTY